MLCRMVGLCLSSCEGTRPSPPGLPWIPLPPAVPVFSPTFQIVSLAFLALLVGVECCLVLIAVTLMMLSPSYGNSVFWSHAYRALSHCHHQLCGGGQGNRVKSYILKIDLEWCLLEAKVEFLTPVGNLETKGHMQMPISQQK